MCEQAEEEQTPNLFLFTRTILEAVKIFMQFHCLSSYRNDFVSKRAVSVLGRSYNFSNLKSTLNTLNVMILQWYAINSYTCPSPITVVNLPSTIPASVNFFRLSFRNCISCVFNRTGSVSLFLFLLLLSFPSPRISVAAPKK